MNPDIKKYLLAFELEKIQEHKNMAVGLGEGDPYGIFQGFKE